MTPRPWWATALVYQLYLRSFADTTGDRRGDGVGDLDGIRDHLDHVASLGVDAIWLNPCYPSPQYDHGYDVANFMAIDECYGDLEVFDALVAEAGARDIRVLMDVVPNHCSTEHAWFRAALAAPGSPERERFFFRDGRGAGGDEPPNNWQAVFGGPAWTRITEPDGSPGQWYLHSFTPAQPDFDWSCPDVADYFDEVLRFWFDRGVDGFRVDAVARVGKAPGLPDCAPSVSGRTELDSENPWSTYRPEGHVAWARWRRLTDQYERDHPGRVVTLVAEAYTPRRPDLFRQYVNDQEFHQAFAFDLLLAPWHAGLLRDAIDDAIGALAPNNLLPTWTLNNHDTQRCVTRYGHADAHTRDAYTGTNLVSSREPVDMALGTRRARAAALMQFALPGSVYLYMGEELGLPEVLDIPDAARTDPIFFQTQGRELGRDGCRVPMPWTVEPDGWHGFSPPGTRARPWLPQPEGWGRWAAGSQDGDPDSMLTLYRRAAAVRRATPALLTGGFVWLPEQEEHLIAFARDELVVVLNTAETPFTLEPALVGSRTVLLSSDGDHGDHGDPLTIPPDTTVWLA